MPLGGTVIGAAKMIPTIVKGAAAAAAKRAAAAEAKRKAAAEAKRKAAAEAKRKAEKKLQEENIYEESTRRVDPIPPTSGAGRPSSPGGVQTNLDLQQQNLDLQQQNLDLQQQNLKEILQLVLFLLPLPVL
jgi:hypothetical protein